jgi:hypothetical protein
MTLFVRRPLAHDDPRRLRELLDRCVSLAAEHTVPSVVVGLAGHEGDSLFPEWIDFLTSALRVEDAVFRLTRERAVLFLADVDQGQVETILARLRSEFESRFAAVRPPAVSVGYYQIPPGSEPLALKEVLPAVFGHHADESYF